VTTAPVLVSPQDSEPFRVEADSLDFATGAVLSQQSTTDGKWHPVAFYSKSLSSVERNYEIHDKEIVTVVPWTSSHILYGLPLYQKGNVSKATC